MTSHGLTFTMTTLSSPDPPALAHFYARLLEWEIETEEPGGRHCATPSAALDWASTLRMSTPRRCGRPSPASS